MTKCVGCDPPFELDSSCNQDIINDYTDIYLADTIGELGLFYRLANIAFIGGSLVNIGGHNPIEAMQLSCPVISGPYVQNFKNLYQDLTINKAVIISNNKEALIKNIDNLIINPNLLKTQINHAKKYILNKENILNQTHKEIIKLL